MDLGQVPADVRQADADAAEDQGPTTGGGRLRGDGLQEAARADRDHVRVGAVPLVGAAPTTVARSSRREAGACSDQKIGARMRSAFRRARVWAPRRRRLVLPVVGPRGAPICKALRRRGFGCPWLGAGRGVGLGLTERVVVDRLLGWIRSSAVCALWLSLPRGTWIESGSPPARSASDPWGKLAPASVGSHFASFAADNVELRAVVQLVKACIVNAVPVCVERPRSSLIWSFPELRALTNHNSFNAIVLDLCQFGSAARSATRIFSWRCPKAQRLHSVCK